jgi:hypothetical protein
VKDADTAIWDVVVFGSSGAGLAAAVQAGRSGLSVLLLEPGIRIGGMTTGGLGATDIGEASTIGGIAKEFYQRVYRHYLQPEAWRFESRATYAPKHRDSINEREQLHFFFEPSVALRIATQLLAEAGVVWRTNCPMDRVRPPLFINQNLAGLYLASGQLIRGRYFIDASYEGDLMAHAGVPYVVGREGNHEFDESLNGFLPQAEADTAHLDPYLRAGDATSGLLPGIVPDPQRETGSADQWVQAYNFRFCLTNIAANRIAISRPADYNPLYYELLLRHIRSTHQRCRNFPFFKTTPIPNCKTDSNNLGNLSTDFVGHSHEWAEASDERRAAIWQQHCDYTLGMLWFLQNDPRVPAAWRREISQWGLAADEFTESGNWPSQLYVREARRMRSDYVVTEQDCLGLRDPHDPVAMGSYAMDSHQVSRYVDDQGRLRFEGGFWKTCRPYPISLRAILPPRGSCPNLAVPVCLSATHAAFGSMRMEPVFMMLGQAAALAAQIALRTASSLQDVPAAELAHQLVAHGAVTAGIHGKESLVR